MKLIIRIEQPIHINGDLVETGTATILNYGNSKHLIFKCNDTYLIDSPTYDHLIKTQKITVL